MTGGKVWRPAAQVTRPQVGRHVGGNRILTNRKSAYKLGLFEAKIGRPDRAKLIKQNMCFLFGVLDPNRIRYVSYWVMEYEIYLLSKNIWMTFPLILNRIKSSGSRRWYLDCSESKIIDHVSTIEFQRLKIRIRLHILKQFRIRIFLSILLVIYRV